MFCMLSIPVIGFLGVCVPRWPFWGGASDSLSWHWLVVVGYDVLDVWKATRLLLKMSERFKLPNLAPQMIFQLMLGNGNAFSVRLWPRKQRSLINVSRDIQSWWCMYYTMPKNCTVRTPLPWRQLLDTWSSFFWQQSMIFECLLRLLLVDIYGMPLIFNFFFFRVLSLI